MASKLMIIESPNKIKTIMKFLTPDWQIIATVGHIRDLAKSGPNGFGFDEQTLEPTWIIPKQASFGNFSSPAERIKEIQEKSSKAKEIYIATDPDREGEAIAWHVYEVIKKEDKPKVLRITFNEITKDAVINAINNPRKINIHWVNSQFARRILDRLVGFSLSKLVHQKLHAKSAGRVQTIALKFIYDREKLIRAFQSYNWWTLKSYLETDDELILRDYNHDLKNINLFNRKNTNPDDQEEEDKDQEENKMELLFSDEASVKTIVNSLSKDFEVYSIDEPTFHTHSQPAPFKTSSLQITAINKLKWNISKVTQVAQHLYEGINVKGEHIAFISYPRTDSIRYSDTFVDAAKKYIIKKYGANYYDEKYATTKPALTKKTDAAPVQDAHEAIRILDFSLDPETIKNMVPADEYKLYKLIWTRTIASLMPPSKTKIIAVRIKNNENKFYTNSSALFFDGYKCVYKEFEDLPGSEHTQLDFNKFKVGAKFKAKEVTPEKHTAPPPAHYTQATLIHALEKAGVGRPSTYKQMANVSADRGYADIVNKAYVLTSLGEKVIDELAKFFSEILNINLTKDMEQHLDDIAHRGENWKEWILDFKKVFDKELKSAKGSMETSGPQLLDRKCPQCGSPLVERYSAKMHKKFVGCSNFPACKYIENSGPTLPPPEKLDEKCPQCGSQLLLRTSRYGSKFIACSGFPKCRYLRPANMTHAQYEAINKLKDEAKKNKTKLVLPPDLQKVYEESLASKKKTLNDKKAKNNEEEEKE